MAATQVRTIVDAIDKNLQDITLLKFINQKFGIKPSKLFFFTTGIVFVFSLFSVFADLLTNLFGMLYPAYMSWKAIEKKDEEQKKIWLAYWIVFGFLSSIDHSLGNILICIPGFYTIRLIIYAWLFFPRPNNGATIIYAMLKVLLEKVQRKIGEASWKGEKKA